MRTIFGRHLIVLFLGILFFKVSVFAAQIPITAPAAGNYQVSESGDYITISGNGSINGSITNSNSANPGHVDIVTNKDYNTGNLNTNFGTSSSSLGYVLVSGSSTSLTISNNFYSNSVFLENSTLNINSGNIKISNIAIHDGNAVKQPGSTININTNYDGNTTFGAPPISIDKNLSIEKINVANNVTLTLNNTAYVDSMNLNSNNSNLVINNDNAQIYGTVSGVGKVSIGNGTTTVDYNNSLTQFGTSGSHLSYLNIKDGNGSNGSSLTLERADGNKNEAYITKLSIDLNSSLNIGKNGVLHGAVGGPGTVNITSSYDNGVGTSFGFNATTGRINNLIIDNSSPDATTLDLYNTAYVNQITIKNSNILNLNNNSKIDGTILGSGTVNIKSNYDNTDGKTNFGNIADSLNNLNITNGGSLSLSNQAYIATTNLENNSVLNLNTNGGIIGAIQGNNSGTVNLNRNYDTLNTTSSNYFNTLFGTNGNSVNTLNVKTSNSFTLGNLAYINNLNLNDSSSSLNLGDIGGLIGTVSGSGSVNINSNYDTLSKDGNVGNDTNLGSVVNSINNVNVISDVELSIGNSSYINNLNLNSNSVLTLNNNANISGTIYGNGSNTTVNVGTIFSDSGLGNANKTIFGTSTNRITTLNVNENGSLSISNDAFINNININSSSSVNGPSLSIKANNGSNVTLNTQNGIRYDSNENFSVIMSLKNADGNNQYSEQIYDLSKFINNTSDLNPNLTIDDNNLYLNVLSRDVIGDGTKFFIDKSTNSNYFDGASLTYETIFKDLKFQTELNSLGETELYLVVNQDRTPTLNDVSQSTLTAAKVIDSWTFLTRSLEENILVSNLQSIKNKNEFFHALTSLAPDVSGANIKMPQQSMISAITNIHRRLSYFRTLKFSSIYNKYNFKDIEKDDIKYYNDYFVKPYYENNSWVEVFGGNLNQSEVEKIYGYDADYYGFTLGYDIRPTTSFVFGFSYTFNSINAKNTDNIKSDRDELKATTHNIDFYAMVYNKYNYLSFGLGGGYNMYDSKRKINFSNFDRTAKATYNGISYYGEVEYGFNILLSGNRNKEEVKTKIKTTDINKTSGEFELGEIRNFIMLTPKISLTYNNISIDKYTEKGADAANLVIKTKDYSFLNLNGGLDLTFNKGLSANTNFQTILRTGISYALMKDKIELNSRYIDDYQEFRVYGFEPNDLSYNLGINFNFNFYEKIDIGISYDYTFGDNFNGSLVRLTFLYAF